jgi:uncharacterized protein YodC (DUF2158 family)
MSFDKGDTVTVKSGGPALTVLEIDGEHIKCLFFSDELGEFKETTLPAFALEAATDEDVAEASVEDDEDDEDSEDEEDQPAGGRRKVA